MNLLATLPTLAPGAGREPAEVGLCVCGGGGGGPVRADPPRSDCCEEFEVERCIEEVEPLAPLDRFGELFATGPFDSLLNDGGGGGGAAPPECVVFTGGHFLLVVGAADAADGPKLEREDGCEGDFGGPAPGFIKTSWVIINQ